MLKNKLTDLKHYEALCFEKSLEFLLYLFG